MAVTRYWDRGMWFGAMTVAGLLVAVGGWSMLVAVRGSAVAATVGACRTELHLNGKLGRHVTTCAVTAGGTAAEIEMAREYEPGTTRTLTAYRDSLSDPELDSDHTWLLPVGAAVARLTWWLGYPPATPRPPKPRHW